MSEDVKGVFVRLPLSVADAATFKSELNDTRVVSKALLAIGTPVTGGELEVVGYADAADLPLEDGSPTNWTAVINAKTGKTCTVALVRQSEAQAQIAARDAEIVRLRSHVEKIDKLIMGNSDPVMMFCGIHANCTEALKGGAA